MRISDLIFLLTSEHHERARVSGLDRLRIRSIRHEDEDQLVFRPDHGLRVGELVAWLEGHLSEHGDLSVHGYQHLSFGKQHADHKRRRRHRSKGGGGVSTAEQFWSA